MCGGWGAGRGAALRSQHPLRLHQEGGAQRAGLFSAPGYGPRPARKQLVGGRHGRSGAVGGAGLGLQSRSSFPEAAAKVELQTIPRGCGPAAHSLRASHLLAPPGLHTPGERAAWWRPWWKPPGGAEPSAEAGAEGQGPLPGLFLTGGPGAASRCWTTRGLVPEVAPGGRPRGGGRPPALGHAAEPAGHPASAPDLQAGVWAPSTCSRPVTSTAGSSVIWSSYMDLITWATPRPHTNSSASCLEKPYLESVPLL